MANVDSLAKYQYGPYGQDIEVQECKLEPAQNLIFSVVSFASKAVCLPCEHYKSTPL